MRYGTLLILTATVAPANLATGQIVELDKLVASDGSGNDQLGVSTDIDAERIIVGAWAEDSGSIDQGAAYIYRRDGNNWVQEQKLSASQPGGTDLFGVSVAISGETAVVGSYVDDVTFSNQGSVEVWVRTGGMWTFQQKLVASDPKADQWFGGSVDLEGDTLVVGAQFDTLMGAAYVFRRTGTTWTEEQKLASNDLALSDLFGVDVAIEGERILVGACGKDNDRGAAYVFERSGTTWTQTKKLERANSALGDLFATSVAMDEDRLVCGSPGLTNGAADVFVRQVTNWIHEEELVTVPLCNNCDSAGDVAIDGDRIAVAAGGFQTVGAVFLFERGGAGWDQRPFVQAASSGAFDVFGSSVAIHEHTLAIGQLGDDDSGLDAGAAFAFDFVDAYTPFCYGGGDLPGCTPCPCGNDASGTSPGGCINGAGSSAELIASGNPRQTNDSLRFEVTDANPATFAVLVSAENRLPNTGPCPIGSGILSVSLDGLRCVGGNLLRHGSRATDASGSIGATNNGWGPPNGPPGGLIAQGGFVAGQTRQYQSFYREQSVLGCGTGQNTTNGISTTFRP